ncbi:MAG: type II secretion system protein [Candidatus Peribacteria bacterium]|nr:MAG: type II secretion system protein [Candidatus Peribacteria bacterium]
MICHPKGQSGFTLIEMILVIGVLGILMSLGSYLFVATDNNKYYAETCANNIYSTIKNYQYSALVGKQLDG